MDSSLLFHKHTGPLRVVIYTLDEETDSWILDFKETTLFEYIGEACARIFTNLTTKLTIETCPDDWEIIEFSPENNRLEAKQIGGEPLRVEEDDPERVSLFFPIIDPTLN